MDVPAGEFRLTAEADDFPVDDEGEVYVTLHRGEGFSEAVTFVFEPGEGLTANPTESTPAADQSEVASVMRAASPGEYRVEVTATAESGQERKVTVDVTVGEAEGE